jgi:hypothetical protein
VSGHGDQRRGSSSTGHAHTAARHDIFHAPLLNHLLLSHWTTASVLSTYSFAATALPPYWPLCRLHQLNFFYLLLLSFSLPSPIKCVYAERKSSHTPAGYISPPPPPKQTTKEISLFWVRNFLYCYNFLDIFCNKFNDFLKKKKSPKSINITRFLYMVSSRPCSQNYTMILPVFPFIFLNSQIWLNWLTEFFYFKFIRNRIQANIFLCFSCHPLASAMWLLLTKRPPPKYPQKYLLFRFLFKNFGVPH